ncbi:porin [Sansalvadorimonas sp. 2012CJ34-2]|uniref:Porin n=1 Tax=Parendozoicomonas callyspongiae TaxID=2942213 RepID=A0ABT0PE07_9GAMM|nr:porin [Sansalvadorimonas sp. 2012CJ34-2]MCL6269461.1 porin [Sansalvadorimonas sp. 2012CJ34-2]
MKKLVLAAAIAAVASNAMALEVYNADGATVNVFGEIRTRLQSIEDDNTGSKFDMGGSKLGVEAKYAMNDDLTAGGYLRYGFDLNDGDNNVKVSKGYVYLSSNKMGTVTVGKQGSVYDSFIGGYDASTLYGGAAKMASNAAGTDSIESGITYKWSNDSFTVMAQHSLAAEDANTFKPAETQPVKAAMASEQLNKTFALGGSWSSDFGLTLGGAYTLADHDKLTGFATSKNVEIKTVGFEAGYSINAVTLGATMTQIDTESDKDKELLTESNSFGLGVAYAFENGVNAFAGYDIVETEDSSKGIDKKANEDETKSFNIGVDYRPHPQVKTFVEYARAKTSYEETGKKSKTQDKWGVGVRVYF